MVAGNGSGAGMIGDQVSRSAMQLSAAGTGAEGSASIPRALHAEQRGEATRGLDLRHLPNGSAETNGIAAALVRCEVRPSAGCQVYTARSARLATEVSANPLAANATATRQQAREQLGQAGQRGAVDGFEVNVPAARR
jgi:hypothetical protein